jgi:hypothetical protein
MVWFFDAVCRNIGQAGKDQLARSLLTSQSSRVGRRLQGTNGLVKLKDSGLRKMRIVFGKIVFDVL